MLYNKEQGTSGASSSGRRTKFHFDRFVQMVLFIAANPNYCCSVASIPKSGVTPDLKRADILEQKIKSLNNALSPKLKEESRLGGPLHNPSILPAPSFSSLPMSSNGKKTLAGYRPKSRKKQTILPNGQPKECATCGDTWTSQWRSGPNGNVELCSRCGIAYRKKMEKKIRSQQSSGDGTKNFIFKNK
ncbi:AMM_1a_G0055400.mRNA.1.CDS.1 [Saccharomyces cerevisiae]|nr:AMM_1a_G0055400.mRNA.1.CDS.1 [Saccharomyces cerevisiae]CAI6882785.1 AMM_1a_G0055400.mRNA.1.CDS.1 [Saccharomyces cerevisiae]